MIKRGLHTLKNPKSVTSEAYRTLRTNLQFSSIDKEIKTIIVTSANPNEGKTTVISNLAISLAQTNLSVLLVDCDLRNPSIHKEFSIPSKQGLTNILMGNQGQNEVKFYRFSNDEHLTILPSGPIPPNPSELLGSERMKQFVIDMREQFDIVLFDTPPINAVTDSAVLSSYVDGVILVTLSEETEINSAVAAKTSLDKVDANILGVVLNKVKVGNKGYYDYGYYSEETETKKRKKFLGFGKR